MFCSYDMMRSCWHQQPERRPSFVELEQRILALQENRNQSVKTSIPPIAVMLPSFVLNPLYVPFVGEVEGG